MEDSTPTGDFSFIVNNDDKGTQTGNLTAEFSKYNTISCEYGTVGKQFKYSDTKTIPISAEVNSANYFNFPMALYGKNLLLKVGDSYEPIVVNQDYSFSR